MLINWRAGGAPEVYKDCKRSTRPGAGGNWKRDGVAGRARAKLEDIAPARELAR